MTQERNIPKEIHLYHKVSVASFSGAELADSVLALVSDASGKTYDFREYYRGSYRSSLEADSASKS